jgi:hypothetical protein
MAMRPYLPNRQQSTPFKGHRALLSTNTVPGCSPLPTLHHPLYPEYVLFVGFKRAQCVLIFHSRTLRLSGQRLAASGHLEPLQRDVETRSYPNSTTTAIIERWQVVQRVEWEDRLRSGVVTRIRDTKTLRSSM